MDTMIVTGGAGFIGSNFVRYILSQSDCRVINVDKLTYAGSPLNLQDLPNAERYEFVEIDISDESAVESLYQKYTPTYVVNFAAESHVDRSIDHPMEFVQTNIVGAFVLLDYGKKYFNGLDDEKKNRFRFLHVSTDEVYGSLGKDGLFKETTPYSPNSPYAASKASADHFVHAYYETFGLPTLITNCSNNYGPNQFPEKLIPLMLLNALEGKQLPIYGDGGNIRDWLYVEDHCSGIYLVLQKGRLGEKYNIGGNNERTNLELVDLLCGYLEQKRPAAENEKLKEKGISSYLDLKTFVADRPGHDRRYGIDASKIANDLGWQPAHNLASGLERTVEWYLKHLEWCEKIQENNYSRERLGLHKN